MSFFSVHPSGKPYGMLAPAPKISTVGREIISEHRILVELCLGLRVVHTHNICVTRVVNNPSTALELGRAPAALDGLRADGVGGVEGCVF